MTHLKLSNTPPPHKNNRLVSNGYFHSGRTMVEMLGVLAVIGVLSVLMIYGYQVAMNKHYANETIDRLQRRAVTVASQTLTGSKSNLSFDENDGTYQIPNTVEYDDDIFRLQVLDVPEAVCKQIQAIGWKVGKLSPDDCSATTLKFTFLDDLSDCSKCPISEFDCTPYGKECGTCSPTRGYTSNEEACTENQNGQYCVMGRCVQCDKEYFYRNGCLACDKYNYAWQNASESTKYNCLESMVWNDSSEMVACGYHDTIGGAESISCIACANRCFHSENNKCYRANEPGKLTKNPDGTCLFTHNSAGITVFSCQGKYVYRNGCVPCKNFNNYYDGSPSELDKHNCLGDMFWTSSWNSGRGSMVGCINSNTAISGADEISCKRCENRCYLDGTCYWFGEGKPYPYKDANGNCTNIAPN